MFGGPSGKLPPAFNHDFSTVPATRLPRSAFDRSFSHKTTCQASDLVPFYLDEVLPGDTIKINSTIFARMQTQVVPAMDNLEITTQFFFVPNRLVWDNWEKFCGAQDNPGDSISYSIPTLNNQVFGVHDLGDYLGIPPGVNTGATTLPISALPFRGYARIWNEWYRDENIQNSVTVSKADGTDSTTNLVLLKRGKKKDYFYGSLTSAQKGTAVPFLSGTANVYGQPVTGNTAGAAVFQAWNSTDGTPAQFGTIDKTAAAFTTQLGNTGWAAAAAGDTVRGFQLGTAAQYTSIGNSTAPPYADLSTNVIDVVNSLRLAFQTQKFLERDARGGTRYTELNQSHFGVINPDARLQRTEYLGGGSAPINITPIPQTSSTSGSNYLGDLASFATALSPRNGFTKSFTEHGYVFGILCIRVPSLTYQQGVHRSWSRSTRYDFYWPVFANLGEQTVLKKEIYAQGDLSGANHDNSVWGYQERWAEYRYKPSMATGLFRSAATGHIDQYHFAQKYASEPSLNSTFLPDDTATILDRNLTVAHSSTVCQFKLDIYNKLHHARVMPVKSVPGNMDRF